MNAITKELIRELAEKYPAEARENGSNFAELVRGLHRLEIMRRFELKYTQRAFTLYRMLRPDCFSNTGFLLDHLPGKLEDYLAIYRIAIRVIERKVARDPELRLEPWEHPDNYRTYQINMFDIS